MMPTDYQQTIQERFAAGDISAERATELLGMEESRRPAIDEIGQPNYSPLIILAIAIAIGYALIGGGD